MPAHHRRAGSRSRPCRAIKAGQVDLVLNVDPSVITDAEGRSESVELLETGASNSMTVSMWIDTPPFDKSEGARGAEAVVDRQAMVDTVLLGFGEPGADNPVPARQSGLLRQGGAQAGYREGQGAARRGRLHGRAEFRPLHRRRRAGHGAAWRRSLPRWPSPPGIEHQRHRHAGRKLLGRCLAEEADRDLGLVDAPARRGAGRRLYADAKWKETHWERPDYDALLLKANTTVDAAERNKLFQETGEMLAEEGGADPADVRPPGAGAAQGLRAATRRGRRTST